MDIRARHRRAMHEFDDRIGLIPADRWTDPTPCTHWDVTTLVHHVVDEQRWVPLLLSGATVEEAAAELADRPLGGDLPEAWDLARAIGTNERLDEALVDDLASEVAEHREELEASGAFAEPVPVQPTADPQTRLLAVLGRAR